MNVDGAVVFLGNGIVDTSSDWNSYVGRRRDYSIGDLDVAGKAVMFCYDSLDSMASPLRTVVPLERRIIDAATRNASAVILFSFTERYPFLYANYDRVSEIPDIPVITITKNSAANVLESSGIDSESLFESWQESNHPPESVELISAVDLSIKGNFERTETRDFTFRFRRDVITKREIRKIAQVNQESLEFLRRLLEDDPFTWDKVFTVYFRGYDEKLFYTHHWGSGLAGAEGVFMVLSGAAPSLGLAVHENMHIVANSNWSPQSISFLNEGVAKYAEALATDRHANHHKTIQFLDDGTLFHLEDMVTFQVGMPGLKTQVAYPASGSFVEFLITSYGLGRFKEVFGLEGRSDEEKKEENSWMSVYKKSLQELEREWLFWLAGRYELDERRLQPFLNK